MSRFDSYLYERIVGALRQVEPSDAADAYVVSLLVYDEDDEPTRPTVMVSINTERVVRDATGRASDADEARWNYAFWLQDPLTILCDSLEDPDGAALRDEWIEQQGLADASQGSLVTPNFVALLERTVRALHENSVVRDTFGRSVPVLIHELEYYEDIAAQNQRANPDGLADPFAAWIRGI